MFTLVFSSGVDEFYPELGRVKRKQTLRVGEETNEVPTPLNRFDPALDNTVREFSRNLLKKASQSAGVEQDEKVRSKEGVGMYGNYASTSNHPEVCKSMC